MDEISTSKKYYLYHHANKSVCIDTELLENEQSLHVAKSYIERAIKRTENGLPVYLGTVSNPTKHVADYAIKLT